MLVDRQIINSPRTRGATGEPLQPGCFEFVSISISRKELVEDITDIVERVDFVQDIDSTVVVANIVVRDNRSFFENSTIKLLGHETVDIRIREIAHSRDNTNDIVLNLRFVVKEYKDFELDSSGIYTKNLVIEAISPYAYISRLGKISIEIKNDVDSIENIFRIFKEYLRYPDNLYNYDKRQNPCISNFRAVINYQTPLQAINWLRKKSFDSDKSPFFLFNSLSTGQIIARSWKFLTDLRSNKVYKRYIQRKTNDFAPGTYESYNDEKDKLLDFVANVKNNEIEKLISGKYTLRVKTIDYSNLNYFENDESFSQLSERELKELLETRSARRELIESLGIEFNESDSFVRQRLNPAEKTFHKPFPLYDVKSSRDVDYEHLDSNAYYNTKLNFESYEAVVYGDFNLNPGLIISLTIPRSGVDNDIENSALSDNYLVRTVVHSFANGKYVNKLGLIKI
jgi:hypothetical protein